ncbi:MAG: peptidylprolyl isomerase [Kofleriaceae bacterium]
MSWKSIVREPLVHFIAIGAVLFAVDAWRTPDEPGSEHAPAAAPEPAPAKPVAGRTPLVIDAVQRRRIAAHAATRLGRPPTEPEIAAEVERWIDEEVMFREAIARGLDRDDPLIHQRIASRMTYVLEQAIIVPEPSEAALRAWFAEHRERWAVPDRVDFTHVFVAGTDAAATAKLAELERVIAGGAPSDRLGDPFPGGRRYRGRKLADLALAFGDSFVAGLGMQPIGTWTKRTSRHGLHLVRLDRTEAGRAAEFAAARLDVRQAWVDERRGRELAAAIARLRAGWEIQRL